MTAKAKVTSKQCSGMSAYSCYKACYKNKPVPQHELQMHTVRSKSAVPFNI